MSKTAGELLSRTYAGQTKQNISEQLHQAGIPGIKYLDQGSRRLTDAEIREEIERIKDTEERARKFGQAAAPGSIGPTAAAESIARWEAQIGKPFTHNFVVFDDKLIDIARKYGIPAMIGAGAAHYSLQPVDHDPFSQ